MKISGIDVDDTLKKAEAILSGAEELSPAVRSLVEQQVLLITLLVGCLNQNSRNSSKPPSSDPNRKKESRAKGGKKTGGQKGHVGVTLQKVNNPDKIEVVKVNRRNLPPGQYKIVGYETRQVFDMQILRMVTEYQAEILEDGNGRQFVATFPEGVTKAVQYGKELKAHVIYMLQYQLIPYGRIQEYFSDQIGIPVSEGSIYNFTQEAYGLLEPFEVKVKEALIGSDLAHADETSININRERQWLHSVSNGSWTYCFPHKSRGSEAMDYIGILPLFGGVLCHDHLKAYYKYSCLHALCNAHHIRELEWVWENEKHQWARDAKLLLQEMNNAVNETGGVLKAEESERYRQRFRLILKTGEAECPPPDLTNRKGKRGRVKRTKARNLLERLQKFEDDTLRFMDNKIVPFTNNLAENDIRMTKVQQKISGCFRSLQGAKYFCRIRSFLSTCQKQAINLSQALKMLFRGDLPVFAG